MKGHWITSIEELSDFRVDWEALRTKSGGSVFTSYDLDISYFQGYEDMSPWVFVIWDGAELVGIAPLASYQDMKNSVPIETLAFIGGGRTGRLRYNHLSIICDPRRPEF